MINKLINKIQKTKAPIVVGLDPMLSYVPEHIQKKAFDEFGETLEGAAEAIWQFNKEIVDKTYDLIPAVKPQIAMYEQFGIEGLKAYKKTVDYCKSKDLVVIGDIKRGDIGSTSAAYATGHLGKVQVGSKTYAGFDEDFATVNPCLLYTSSMQGQSFEPLATVGLFLALGLLMIGVWVFSQSKWEEQKSPMILELMLFFGLAAAYFLPYMDQTAGCLLYTSFGIWCISAAMSVKELKKLPMIFRVEARQ